MDKIGFLADDLTGAADVMAQAHARGLDAALTLDPSKGLPTAADVVGIAGPARSLQGAALDEAIRGGLEAFRRVDVDVLLYKVCSTFDSSPTIGNIGRALEILHEYWPEHGAIPVAPAQPEFGRYTAFSQHFGLYQGDIYRLDRHPVMSRHPATPMNEADLREILRSQLSAPSSIEAIQLPDLTNGLFHERWQRRRAADGAFVVDAVEPWQMDDIAAALLDEQGTSIVVGSGGIMAALARLRGTPPAQPAPSASSSGAALAVSASASSTTAIQIADAVDAGWVEVAIPPSAFTTAMPEGTWVDDVAAALESGEHVIAHTLRGLDDPRLGSGDIAAADVGGTIGRLAETMVKRGLTRDIAIFGGDSSSHALLALGVTELRVQEQFVTAGPLCTADEASVLAGCRLLLKGGQVGPEDILRRFVGTHTSRRTT